MMSIQAVLAAILLFILFYFLQNRNSARMKAGKKVLFVIFIIFAITTIFHPDMLTELANMVGVGRGVDLLLYGMVLAFIFVVINIYLKFKDFEQRINKLARSVAIASAEVREVKD